jgi:hypothetical protein
MTSTGLSGAGRDSDRVGLGYDRVKLVKAVELLCRVACAYTDANLFVDDICELLEEMYPFTLESDKVKLAKTVEYLHESLCVSAGGCVDLDSTLVDDVQEFLDGVRMCGFFAVQEERK